MGESVPAKQCLFILVAFSRYQEALEWGVNQLTSNFGAPLLQSGVLPFNETTYYTPEMGSDLLIQLTAFNLIDPSTLSAIKNHTNELEVIYKENVTVPEERPLNLDPGYLNANKFVLATTKDANHRLYLGDGIYAESTLYFQSAAWQNWSWTYRNYQRQDHKDFLLTCRKAFLKEIASPSTL